MRVDRTPASVAAAVVTAGLATGLLGPDPGRSGGAPYLDGALVVGAVLGGLAAAKMACGNCFESRLAAVLLAAVVVVGAILTMTVGLPGGDGQEVTVGIVALLVVGLLVPALLVVDARLRRHRAPAPPPYAL